MTSLTETARAFWADRHRLHRSYAGPRCELHSKPIVPPSQASSYPLGVLRCFKLGLVSPSSSNQCSSDSVGHPGTKCVPRTGYMARHGVSHQWRRYSVQARRFHTNGIQMSCQMMTIIPRNDEYYSYPVSGSLVTSSKITPFFRLSWIRYEIGLCIYTLLNLPSFSFAIKCHSPSSLSHHFFWISRVLNILQWP